MQPAFVTQPSVNEARHSELARAAADKVDGLAPLAVAENTVADFLDVATGLTNVIASLEALRARVIDQAIQVSVHTVAEGSRSRSDDLRLRSLRAELACAMRIPERTAERMLHASESLVRRLPETLAALGSGLISYRHAESMVDETAGLEPERAAELETAALPQAKLLTVAKFRKKLRMLRERLAPESAVERHRQAAEKRELIYEPARDGMAWLSAYLPAVDALAAYNRVTDIAEALQRQAARADSDGEQRTLAQRRADVFVDLLQAGELADGPHGIRPTVQVTVPVLRLLGRADDSSELASLDGYGPIDDETARLLTAAAPSLTRLLTHPETGAVLSVGRDSYTVPADLKRWLRLRDGTCRFPGCSRSAERCDLDHTRDWAAGGSTAFDNLAHLCRGHHTLKHKTPWQLSNDGAVLTWTSPSGRSYVTQPELMLRR